MTSLALSVGFLAATVLPMPQGEVAPLYPPAVETQASRIFNTTMSPFCPGLLLSNCPSPQAGILRDRIRAELAAGIPAESVTARLYAEYGDQLRATPPPSGFGLLAWVMPGLALVAAGVAVALWLRRTTRQARAAPPPPEQLDEQARARLDRELSKL
jgi:cytochrome c-type biogenesis protein CcmH